MTSSTTNIKRTVVRYLCFCIGVGVNSFGIAFITKAALGTSPISSLPYVLSLEFPGFSFGMWSFFLNMLFIALQAVVLRRDFHLVQLLQILVNVLFSWLIDVSMGLLWFMQPNGIVESLLLLLLGCVIMGFGISVEVAPRVIMVPGEGVVSAITLKTRKRFGSVKVVFDITLIAIATALSFIFFHGLNGIGLGTVISALLVGRFVNLWSSHFPLIAKIKGLAPQQTL